MRRVNVPRLRTANLIGGVVIFACSAAVGGYLYQKNEEINTVNRLTQEFITKSDKQIETIKKNKAAERARQEEAANRAAEQAASGDGSDVATMDSRACNQAHAHIDPASIDVIVNKKHCIQPLAYEPSDLVTVYGATLSSRASEAFTQLYMAAQSAGQPFYVTSSYRSYQNQVATYNYWVTTSGREGADTYSARPGYSEHQTGFVVDVAANGCALDCFGTTTQYAWFEQNAADYGFIQRYYSGYEAITGYKAEEWHYRYVGVPVAQAMKLKGIKTLEEYWGVSGGGY